MDQVSIMFLTCLGTFFFGLGLGRWISGMEYRDELRYYRRKAAEFYCSLTENVGDSTDEWKNQ